MKEISLPVPLHLIMRDRAEPNLKFYMIKKKRENIEFLISPVHALKDVLCQGVEEIRGGTVEEKICIEIR